MKHIFLSSTTRRRFVPLLAGAIAALAMGRGAEAQGPTEVLLDKLPGEPRLAVHGYADLQYGRDTRDEGATFLQNELSAFVRATTEDERWTAFSEIEFDHIDGDVYLSDRGGDSVDVEMEAGWIEFRHDDRFRLRAGKLLLPQYWQSNHYPNLTMSALAPLMSGNIFPKSIVALQASGDWWNAQDRGVGYSLFLGGGAKTALEDLEQNDNVAAGGRVTFRLAGRERPGWLDTLDLSFSGLIGEDDQDRSEIILGMDAQVRLGRLEILAELAHRSQPRLDQTWLSDLHNDDGETLGLYVQAAWRLSEKWHLFYRYDYLDLNDGGGTLRDESRHTLGANFRPRANVSLKVEAFHSQPEAWRASYDGVAGSVVLNF